MNKVYPTWAMCATPYDDLEFGPTYPIIAQPKLNGVRAKWDISHQLFITRQGKAIPERVLPHLYEKMRSNKDLFVCSLDGELYSNNLRFQDIAGIVSPNRAVAHEEHESINFHVFDLISDLDTLSRQNALVFYPVMRVPYATLYNENQLDIYLKSMVDSGYEGLMLRVPGCPYTIGRTKALIKLKPWKYGHARIIGFNKGKGKYVDTLGALAAEMLGQKYFNVSGGLTDKQRKYIWIRQRKYIHQMIMIKYRELSRGGIPIQPQVVSL